MSTYFLKKIIRKIRMKFKNTVLWEIEKKKNIRKIKKKNK